MINNSQQKEREFSLSDIQTKMPYSHESRT